MSSQKSKGRSLRKVHLSPELSSANNETVTLLEQTSTSDTITSLEDTNFISEAAIMKVTHTPQSDRIIITLRRNQDTDIENYGLRLNNLIDKKTRYQLHTSFLSKCIVKEIISNTLRYTIEPSISNYIEEFLTKWHKIQEDCLIKLMELIRDFSNQALNQKNFAATISEQIIKQNTSNEEFVKLKDEICLLERQSKYCLQLMKSKNLSNL